MGQMRQMFGKHLAGCQIVESPVRAPVIIASQIRQQTGVELPHIAR